MKSRKKNAHLRIYRPNSPAYPNAADTEYFARKALDAVTAVLSVLGLVAALLFLVTLA